MSNLPQIITDFLSISLDEMDDVKLMSRTDTKFAFQANKMPLLLKKLLPFYRVLAIDGKLIHDYKSLYFDTKDRKFYLDHHNGRINRNKIRFREYVGSKLAFLEIKLKNNKGKTIKKRMKVDAISSKLSEKQQKYIDKIIGGPIDVSAKQWINFSRITFVHKTQKERLTMDVNLTFENANDNGDMKHIVIATHFGTFKLKELFSEAYRKDNGEVISTKEIKTRLQEIITSEDKNYPFTDEKLASKF